MDPIKNNSATPQEQSQSSASSLLSGISRASRIVQQSLNPSRKYTEKEKHDMGVSMLQTEDRKRKQWNMHVFEEPLEVHARQNVRQFDYQTRQASQSNSRLAGDNQPSSSCRTRNSSTPKNEESSTHIARGEERNYAIPQPPDYPLVLDHIQEAAQLVYDTEYILHKNDAISAHNTLLIKIEKVLLELAAQSNVCRGLTYFMGVKGHDTEQQIIRYLEAGVYKGALKKLIKDEEVFCDDSTIPLYRIYSEEDVETKQTFVTEKHSRLSESRKKSTTKIRNRCGEVYKRKLKTLIGYVEEFKKSASECGVITSFFINILRCNPDIKDPRHNYATAMFMPSWRERLLQEKLLMYRLTGEEPYPSLNDFDTMNLSIQDQLDVISTIANDPHQKYPLTGSPGFRNTKSDVGNLQYLSYQPVFDDHHETRHLPASPRNRLIYFTVHDRKKDLDILRLHLFGNGEQNDIQHDITQANLPSVKRRRTTTRKVDVTCDMLENLRMRDTYERHLNTYEHFKTQVVEEGIILWRLHTSESAVLIFNEYKDGGEILPNDFCEISYSYEQGIPTCSCKVYHVISSLTNPHQDEDAIPDGVLCMHCRFFKEFIQPNLLVILSESYTQKGKIADKLRESRKVLNDPIVRLTIRNPNGITNKFSVRAPNAQTIGQIHIAASGIMIMCSNGTCRAAMKNRSIKRLLEEEEAHSLCEHMRVMVDNKEIWAKIVQEDLDSDQEVETGADMQAPADMIEVMTEHTSGNFNLETCTWEFSGRNSSNHKPTQQDDILLSKNIRKRHKVDDDTFSRRNGCLNMLHLKPTPRDEECDCGEKFANEDCIEEFECTLYTRHAPVTCKVYALVCTRNECSRKLHYSGKEDSIFFWSNSIAAGDEIGWDFVEMVHSMRISFTAYCDNITRIYKSSNPISSNFMSRSSFVSWFFAWASQIVTDFRQHVDPWCGYAPKAIAGDGTHVGIAIRNVNITPIDKADTEEVKVLHHKRYDRVLLPYPQDCSNEVKELVRKARNHLHHTSKRYLSETLQPMTAIEKERMDENLLTVCPQDPFFLEIMQDFVAGVQSPSYKQALAKFFLSLCNDATISTIIPPQYTDTVNDVCITLLTDTAPPNNPFTEFCPELNVCLREAWRHQDHIKFAEFLLYLIDNMRMIFQNDLPTSLPSPIDHTYNPESGVAYYFSPHGKKLRELPIYTVTSTSNTYDDDPCGEQRCGKRYAKVSRGGWSHMFLWFCPMHGHCYGFHIIQGSEGRKDPFASLVKYCDEAPQEVFYDFACSLSEYALNREPEFFKNTRFWHDVFHGTAHKCGQNFKSRRIPQLSSFNTSICEQFNSFIQSIKYTGTHLSQTHFCFFVQFMIYVWNERKTKSFQDILDLALAGHE